MHKNKAYYALPLCATLDHNASSVRVWDTTVIVLYREMSAPQGPNEAMGDREALAYTRLDVILLENIKRDDLERLYVCGMRVHLWSKPLMMGLKKPRCT